MVKGHQSAAQLKIGQGTLCSAMDAATKRKGIAIVLGLTGILTLITLIIILSNIYSLGIDEQVVITSNNGKEVVNGPVTKVLNPFREKTERKATRLDTRQYAVVKNTRTGIVRHEEGPTLLFLEGWDEIQSINRKIVLQLHQYTRLVDSLSGIERVVPGPIVFTPNPFENAPNGTEDAVAVSPDESVLVLERLTNDRSLITTEGMFTPAAYQNIIAVRRAVVIGPRHYAVTRHIKVKTLTNVPGPYQLKVGAWEELVEVKPKIVLERSQYIRLVNQKTGYERVVVGPTALVPLPSERSALGTQTCVTVSYDTSVVVLNKTTGLKRVVTTEGLFAPEAYEFVQEVRKATLLGPQEYAVVENEQTGLKRHVAGPDLLKVGAYDEVLEVRPKILLERDQYVRLINRRTGSERVLNGPALVVPQPTERYPEGVQKAEYVNEGHAVLVMNQVSGMEQLVDTAGLYSPPPYVRVLEDRELIRVLPHEAAITRNELGVMTIYNGSNTANGGDSFFLPAYSNILEMRWSSYEDRSNPGVKVPVSRIDMRTQKMMFEYEVQTNDNVKLALEGILFWRVNSVLKMVNATSDPAGDVYQKARSKLIQEVSKVTLEAFMSGITNVTAKSLASAQSDDFFTFRGVELTLMEITSYQTLDPETSKILQQIILETTQRINNLQKQESENAVNARALEGQIQLERQRTQLINIKAENERLNATMQGNAAGLEIAKGAATFISGLNVSVPDVAQRVQLYSMGETLKARNMDTKNLANSKVTLFMRPQDVNLKDA